MERRKSRTGVGVESAVEYFFVADVVEEGREGCEGWVQGGGVRVVR